MKKQSNHYCDSYILKRITFLTLCILIASTGYINAQHISRQAVDYPNGEVPSAGACTDPTVLTDPACIINLEPAHDGYNFQIPLVNESDRANLTFIFIPSGGCNSGDISCSPDGTITMAISCEPSTGDNYIQFDIQTIHNINATTDQQRYRIPILRNPVKVVLVIDRSGSMGWPIPGGTEVRWEVLKKSVWEFTKQLEIFQQDDTDSIGLTYFQTTDFNPGIPINDGFILIPPPSATELASDTINYLMGIQTPGGATAMGMGLQNAKSKLEGNTPIGATKIVLLFTDGLQNQFPLVNADGRTLQDGSLLNDGPVNAEDSIRYYTIGMGSLALVPSILSEISAANSGKFLYTTTGDYLDFELFFDNHFTDMLSGGSPQIVSRQIGKLVNGEGTHTFNLNSGVTKALFKVSHKDGDSMNFTLEKNGIEYTPEIIDLSFVKMALIKFPVISEDVTYASGEWTIHVTGNSNEEYYVTCIADDHYLDYECNSDKNKYISGEFIEFVTDLSYAGEALTSANESVEVVVLKPGDDLGHLMATYEMPDEEIDYTNEELTPEEQKFLSLMNDPNMFEKLLPNEQIITLQHQGNGIYKGTYNATEISGIYQAIYKLKGEIPFRDQFEREKFISIVIENGGFASASIGQINDITPPSVPNNLNASDIRHDKVVLTWEASIDNVLIKDYNIYKNGSLIDSTSNTSYEISDLEFSTEYSFYIVAKDIARNHSGASTEITATTLDEPDTQAPDSPTNLVADDITQTNLYLTWDIPEDNFGVHSYSIFQDGEEIATVFNNSYLTTNLSPGTNYSFVVTAADEAGNVSEQSNVLNIATVEEPQPLTYPTKLIVLGIKQTTLNLNWNASTGGVGYVEYDVYKDGSFIGKTSNISYVVVGLEPSTSYKFHVISKDSKGNISDASDIAEATTLEEIEDQSNGYRVVSIRPINKFGYYLGPGFKHKIHVKFKRKGPKPTAEKTSLSEVESDKGENPEPYLKSIKDNLDGSYYLILANVLPNTNPSIEIMIGEEVYYEGPVNGKFPIWIYILIILIVLLILLLRKSKSNFVKVLLWLLLIVILIIYYLHRTGFLNFI